MEKNTTKTILIVGGSIAGLYILAKSGAFQKAQEALGGSLPSIGINLPFNLGDLGLGSQLPFDLGKIIDAVHNTCPPILDINDLLPDNSCPSCVTNPSEHATPTDVLYTMPSWAKGAIGVSASILGAYGGYRILQASAPVLRAAGAAAARGIGGAASTIARALSGRATATVAAKTATSIVPKVGAGAATRGILGGLLPTIAFAGIAEGAYQIFRMIRGEGYIGPTGVPPLDIINWIRGRSAIFGTPENALEYSTLLTGRISLVGAAGPAAGGAPIQTEPTWGMMEYGAAENVRWGGQPMTAAAYAKAVNVTPVAAKTPVISGVVASLPAEQKSAWLKWEANRFSP